MNKLIITTAYISIIVQLFTGIVGGVSVVVDLPKKDKILTDIAMIAESIVQVVELIFYIWLILSFSNISYNVTLVRYLDWVINNAYNVNINLPYLYYILKNNIKGKRAIKL